LTQTFSDSRLANIGANAICNAFDYYQTQFKAITRRAEERFENRDWHGTQADAAERLELYKGATDQIVAEIRDLLEERVSDELIWVSMKAVYSGLIAERDDWELAETFFNSATRRIFATVGVDPQIEFVDTDFDTPPTQTREAVYRAYPHAASTDTLIENILRDFSLRADYQDLQRDVRLAAAEAEACLRTMGLGVRVERAEMIKSVFYRGQGAYLIGRLHAGERLIPLVLCLLNTDEGVVLDAVLMSEDEVSILFSFTRSYFHVEVERPYDLVHFLKSIMPYKRIAELYISVGYNKHGKTELYRDLLHHLAHSNDKFEVALGERGMVMLVFTLPSYDLVFKIIKDRFAEPKRTSRQQVMEKYQLVFKRDRAGRLVDAQEFEHLKFDRGRFSEELLDELRRAATSSVLIGEEYVIINHLYTERRLAPLNIYVHEAEEGARRAAVMDYGDAMKDLARANIFPGDILLKNFGVTRHGRVVFYDYDELCLLTDCTFRAMPQPTNEDEELAQEPWFYVGDNDFFPEEFRTWLGLDPGLRLVFHEHHADLFEVDFWANIQNRIKAGEIIHIYPYPQSKRLQNVDADGRNHISPCSRSTPG
jgi:isocitrate dehydrogenase kinase/phosphatase